MKKNKDAKLKEREGEESEIVKYMQIKGKNVGKTGSQDTNVGIPCRVKFHCQGRGGGCGSQA
jgi:hypothetical protein